MAPSFKPFPPRRKPPSNRPLADLVGAAIGPTLARHGFGEADVLLHWTEIVGADLAERCQPLRMQWRARGPEQARAGAPAVLIVRVEGTSALALQHMERVIVERVNGYLGWACVARIALRQGPVHRVPKHPPPPAPPSPQSLREARRRVEGVEDPDLRDALARLGSRALLSRAEP